VSHAKRKNPMAVSRKTKGKKNPVSTMDMAKTNWMFIKMKAVKVVLLKLDTMAKRKESHVT
jgi:hypothetical protein